MEVISSFIIFSVRRKREKQQRRNRKIKETTGRPGREVPGGTGFVFSELRICLKFIELNFTIYLSKGAQ